PVFHPPSHGHSVGGASVVRGRRVTMPTYMTGFDYEGQAWRLMVERPEDREAAARAVVEAAGGRLLSWYWMFGDHDGVLIYEAPSDAAAAAVLAAVAASGRVRCLRTNRL